ncbi:MAG: hypothetical protein JW825_06420 [Candidatus Methanofastidiosa archaeon]|nr:hypothetical protein [Candidatus Methanofastidiosa archaeon]
MEEKIKTLIERLKIYRIKMEEYEKITNEYLFELRKINSDLNKMNDELLQIMNEYYKKIK